jgi:hypothetical protein
MYTWMQTLITLEPRKHWLVGHESLRYMRPLASAAQAVLRKQL